MTGTKTVAQLARSATLAAQVAPVGVEVRDAIDHLDLDQAVAVLAGVAASMIAGQQNVPYKQRVAQADRIASLIVNHVRQDRHA